MKQNKKTETQIMTCFFALVRVKNLMNGDFLIFVVV